MSDYAGSGSRLDDLTYTKVFPYQQTWQDTVVDAPMRFALERGAKFRHCCFPSPLKKPKSTATLLAWDDGGLIMHFIMSALAFSFLFALALGLI